MEIFLQLNDGDRIGVEGTKVSYVAFQKWQNDLKTKPKRLELVSSPPEVFNSCWPDRPAPPRAKAFPLPLEYSGVSTQEKIKKIREEMRKNNAYGLIVAALDEVACECSSLRSFPTHSYSSEST
jgi:Xaa-Pro aminopeptidase